jgi:hypothetical protein
MSIRRTEAEELAEAVKDQLLGPEPTCLYQASLTNGDLMLFNWISYVFMMFNGDSTGILYRDNQGRVYHGKTSYNQPTMISSMVFHPMIYPNFDRGFSGNWRLSRSELTNGFL